MKYLTKTNQSNEQKGDCVYFGTDRREAAGFGDILAVPIEAGKVDTVMVTFIPTSGSGYVQTTISESEPYHWETWDAGTVSGVTTDVFYGVRGVRVCNVTGTVGIEVRAY